MINFVRMATAAEIEAFEKVEAILLAMDEDKAEAIIEQISNYVFAIANEKEEYQRLRRVGRKLGLTVKELTTWFACDEF